ncbi:hypothetical protein SAMN02745172_00953 [Pseudoxanthobacter soli DSM 19599]|uniref:Uncharacterized protein n=1 Tax=Pseudoxanthobacter soli DSM 19599 TaxID=1123029 RepID=A0A1M7ZBR6_9HYPH|nr:hypothetical protein [Pseudoxanthobacter soli]SHO62348.1 hypothetical protein SAMN02745172_00953 [Pseudoxanthobacter soli DSM 19599]
MITPVASPSPISATSAHGVTAARAALPQAFRRIRLDLAREKGHPEGSNSHTYAFVAPLDVNGHISPELWAAHREVCRAVRNRDGEQSIGHLVRRPGGSWAFRYPADAHLDDEAGYHFGDERFLIGEYVSIHEHDGMHTFRVIAVEPV